ncbi:helix-turn-helix domain-containing protein [Actinomadura rifamycini]|uniref:helix-turn-helix domain-containing protein n=1 Tax=Actinomadura rifamycini TaxID=31962 RepID=UPI000403BFBC|nr:helix-turn-helix transcriptional regulator [Actinomadura rifamycini]
MPSAYLRRRRLAVEMRKLREERGVTVEEVAGRIYLSKSKITRLENAQLRPELADIMSMLDIYEATPQQQESILRLAREAAQRGWWDGYGMSMGPRQKIAADFESSAQTIRSYDQTAMPGVLQTREFLAALIELDQLQGTLEYVPERLIEAREHRQQELLRPDGPTYETILDECVIHRLAVPPDVKAAQIRHLVSTTENEERITFRVLPHDALIPGGLLPKSSFYLYSFADPGDPPTAVVDTVTTDFILTQRKELTRYNKMYDRLREVALSTEDSITFLKQVADGLTDEAGSKS